MSKKRMPTSSKHRGVKIRRRGQSWQVDYGMLHGKRVQRSFPTKELAKANIDAHKAREAQDRAEVLEDAISLLHLAHHERLDVLEAREVLRGMASLREAAEFYVRHHAAEAGSCTVDELLKQYVHAKEASNRREWHIKTIGYRIGRFAQDFGSRKVCDITSAQVERWLDSYRTSRGKPLSPVSRNNFLTYLNGFFNFAIKHNAAGVNPIEKIDRARYDRGEIAILTPEQVRVLLFAARKHTPELVPYLAIAVFAGVRPNELRRLDWDHVNFELRYIHITSTAAKGRSERYIDMEDVLVSWLDPWRGESGPMCPQDTYTFTRLFNKARREAGLKSGWANDVLRHTYASYHVARYERKDRTALMMGHSVKMLDKHYRKPLHRSHVAEFWGTRPD